MRWDAIVALALAFTAGGLSGCKIAVGPESSRGVNFYSLDHNGKTSDGAPASNGKPVDSAPAVSGKPVLAVERFRAPEVFDDVRMAYRQGAQIQQFRLQRWAGPPTDLVREACVQAFRGTNYFSWVDRSESGRSGACFRLEGEIHEMCIVSEPQSDEWRARLKLTLRLVRIGHTDQDQGFKFDPRWTLVGQWPGELVSQPRKSVDAAMDEAGYATTLAQMVSELGERLANWARDVAEQAAQDASH